MPPLFLFLFLFLFHSNLPSTPSHFAILNNFIRPFEFFIPFRPWTSSHSIPPPPVSPRLVCCYCYILLLYYKKFTYLLLVCTYLCSPAMPTPVGTARQCLTEEAARALDDAVAVARRRSHAQTTSLHAVSALLALPSSQLREACARARSSAYSPRLQFRALELCVGVSLDRLPTVKALEEPPVSNSLMAAIRRSQANQRRQPETFHLYQQMQQQQQQSSQSSVLCVKVELKHFMLSILDDPIVSRVFGEAGFRSCDIKLAILHPPPRFSRSRCAPLFLCNFPDADSSSLPGFKFPFAGVSTFETEDGNSRRIGEVLLKKKGKNPLLIGVCSKDALSSFLACVRTGKNGVLPSEIEGLSVVSISTEISEFVAKAGSHEVKQMIDLKLKEVSDSAKNRSGPGVVANIGELNVLIGDGASDDSVKYVVSQLTGLVEIHGEKLWLIGATESYETYAKMLAQFPAIEKDWDLHLLPITSSRPSSAGLSSKPSLMGSFVPLGGFFSTPTEYKNILSSTSQCTRCDVCNEKYEQEVSAILMGGSTTSVAGQYSAGLSSWLLTNECGTSKRKDVVKAKDDGTALNAKLMGLQRKWNDFCLRLHPTRSFHPAILQTRPEVQPLDASQFISDRKKVSAQRQTITFPVASETGKANSQTKLPVEAPNSHQLEMEIPWPTAYPVCSLGLPSDRTSPSSVTSVTTDLGLGTIYAVSGPETGLSKFEDHKSRLHYFSGSVTAGFDAVSENASNHIASPSSCSGPELGGHVDLKDFKSLCRVLIEKVGRQGEAISTVSQAISRCKTGHGRLRGTNQKGDIWVSFLGQDKLGKKRVAEALAEVISGSRESLFSVDLSFEDGMSTSYSIFDRHDLNKYGVKLRGKTVVDYIAEELSRKPCSVMFLENVDKADLLAQNSLSQAIKTGRFPNSHGKEISTNNVIFVTTADTKWVNKGDTSEEDHVKFSEERILGAKAWQMQVLVGCVAGDASTTSCNRVNVVSIMRGKGNAKAVVSVSKRKLIDMNESMELEKSLDLPKRASKAAKCFLDLNLPVESEDNDCADYEGDYSSSENSEVWLEDFLGKMDERVVFEPFNFDSVAEEVLKEIGGCFQKIVGCCEASLEIDEEVMVQLLAAAWQSDTKRAVEDWVEGVLSRSFAEAKRRYSITARSVVKLVPFVEQGRRRLLMEPGGSSSCLPTRIMLN
ncbi:protein SMAX1-LIKE 6 isoform X2 [Diospyros lotus]|uniref:protein SMAX1-LIKE 6 isoform X2 n=1 Tax=Diospyros lotus TaxID=55363 RepID=UPI002252694B|nr:protein SMAX1-LIKE 6 isoform X2 [Diospyros lotus]